MKLHVTVIPSDNLIIVDGIGLNFDFPIDDSIHAIQWHSGSGEIEYESEEPNRKIESYESEVLPYVQYWETEYSRLESERIAFEEEYNKFENVKERALTSIDSNTSANIFAGFKYSIANEELHFSYDQLDQQNFADTANACLLSKTGSEGLPTSIIWNGYKKSGELVRLTLDTESFLNLYTQGALIHKATQMEIGGQRKSQIENCSTSEEIAELLKSWNI